MSKRKSVKLKSEKITILLLVVVCAILIIIGSVVAFVLVDENGYFAEEEPNSGSIIDTNSISLSYLDDNTVFTYPLSFSEQDIQDTQIVGDSVYVLTSKNLICLSDDGDFIFAKELNYSDAALYSNSKYIIIYDKIGGYYIVCDEDEVLLQEQISQDETFLIAQVDEAGNVLLVTKNSEKSSIFYMYDKNLELVRSFAFTQEYVVDMSIYNSDKIVFATIGSQDGYFISKLYLFDMDSSEQLDSYELGSDAVISVDFIDNQNICVLTQSNIMIAQIIDETSIQFVSNNEIVGSILNYQVNSDLIVITTQEIDDLNKTIISIYGSDNVLTASTSIAYKALDIYADTKYVYVLTAQTLYILNLDGSIHSELELSDSVFGVVSSDTGVYHYSIGVLHKNIYKIFTQ